MNEHNVARGIERETYEDQKGVDVLVKAIREVPVVAYKVILDRFPACQTQSLVDLQRKKARQKTGRLQTVGHLRMTCRAPFPAG